MKDFGRWFGEQALPSPAAAQPSLADQLEDLGLDLMKDGTVWGECCVCKKAMCLTDYMTAEECLRDIDPLNQYCGGSPRCCP